VTFALCNYIRKHIDMSSLVVRTLLMYVKINISRVQSGYFLQLHVSVLKIFVSQPIMAYVRFQQHGPMVLSAWVHVDR